MQRGERSGSGAHEKDKGAGMIGATASVACAYCGAETAKLARDINRAKKRGMKLFCDKKCFGLSRRLSKAKSVKIEEKRELYT